MAEVRKGTDTRLGRVVAIKRLRTDLASDATFQARFRREAQSAASLNHPAVVAVYDTGEERASDGSGVSQPYIVMEYVAGRTLRDVLREGRKILPERALEITSGVLSALDYSHRAGIIHRDIKPGNVMLTASGDVKVMDFGIARAISDAASSVTQTAAVVGTAQYLSPEQARGETVDSRSDVYSAGCLLYELLTGRPPFVGDSPVAVAYQHVREQPTPPSDHDTALPPEVDAMVLKALAKRVEDRYQSAGAMRRDIESYLAGRPVAVAPPPRAAAPKHAAPVPVAEPTGATGTTTAVTSDPTDDDQRPRTGLWVLLGLLVVALLVAGWFLVKDSLFPPAPDQVQVPTLVSMTEDDARAQLATSELSVGAVDREYDDQVDAGLVISSDPTAEDYVDVGTSVDLVVSLGPEDVEVPDVTRARLADAKRQIKQAGLTVGAVKREFSADVAKNRVISQGVPGGSSEQPGTAVPLVVSKGEQPIAIPPGVVGQSTDSAIDILTGAGFSEGNISTQETDSDEDAGTVVGVSPDVGEQVSSDTEITLLVSDGPELVPNVVGLRQSVAEQRIRDRGFNPVVRYDETSTEAAGRVTDQIPSSGEPLAQGSDVNIFVSTGGAAPPGDTPTEDPTTDLPTDAPTARNSGVGLTGNPGRGRGRG
ncbi:MAG: serine/threonine protein kinase [Nocardioides sp.]|nr:serine/threonine protein kinase [Nocardioides sp.]